ncbi:MAG: sodium:solute symporter family protein [Phycisphaerales bacterium]
MMPFLNLLAQAPTPPPPASTTPVVVICIYLGALVVLGLISARMFRGTSGDYFVASRSIGPFMLLMSVFGTTMTAFALVGSTAKSYDLGIGVYGLMASWSGLIHAAVFFLIGIKLWAIGKRYGYVTQIQYFRDRFESRTLGYLLFPILVMLVIPYLLVGLLGAGAFMRGISRGMYPEMFASTGGAIPLWLTGLVICAVVLFYVFFGGVRSAAWANTFQTLVFMVMGVVAFALIAKALGGPVAAAEAVLEHAPEKTAREGLISKSQFLTYMFIPLSVGMFPHLFQHWLTARSAKSFRLTVIAHPVCIMIVWLPCILIGIWAAGQVGMGALRVPPNVPNSNWVLGGMVGTFVHSNLLTGLLAAGVLAAIMSSLDSQFVCLGSMFTNDIVVPLARRDRFSDSQKLWLGRAFVIGVVAVTYLISLTNPAHVFDLGVWCFTGFAALFPLVFAAVYWKRATRAGAIACVLATVVAWLVFFADAMIFTEKGYLGSKDLGTEEYLVNGVMAVTYIFAASLLALIVVSLITKPLSRETIEKFFAIEKA